MLAALTNRIPVTGDALPRAARFHSAAGHERRLFGELSPPWWSAPSAINILLFTTQIKQCIPFSPPCNCSYELKITLCVRGVISPVLANLYLHYVLDLWVNQWRRKKAAGDVIIVRYADDAVLGFQYRDEAELFLKELGERLGKFGLELHPEKTRLIEFGRYAAKCRK